MDTDRIQIDTFIWRHLLIAAVSILIQRSVFHLMTYRFVPVVGTCWKCVVPGIVIAFTNKKQRAGCV